MFQILKYLSFAIFIIVFIIVAGFITLKITKTIFNKVAGDITEKVTNSITGSQTKNLPKDQIKNLTPGFIINNLTGGKLDHFENIHQESWVGHSFEAAYRVTPEYDTSGNKDIKFNSSGWYAPSHSMPRSKLLDVNLNQKIKVRVSADFTGEMKSPNDSCTGSCIVTANYHFSEFGIYMIDEDDNRMGIRLLGTRKNIVRGNDKTAYKFTSLTVENTGNEIIVTDSTGFGIRYSLDFKYVTTPDGGREENQDRYQYSKTGSLNMDKKWMLRINCHVNGEGFCQLDIRDIQVMQ